MLTRRLAFAVAALGLGIAAAPAVAEDVLVRDRDGRPIQFEIEASGVDVRDYARILRRSIHGSEISKVRIRVMSLADVVSTCRHGETSGCYFTGDRQGLIVVPAGPPDEIRHVLLHEYAHHIDAFRGGTREAAEPNGTWRWWVARGMSQRLRSGEVAQNDSLGWSRNVSEVFAEDYVRLNTTSGYGIPWLKPPRRSILAALHEDITGEDGLPRTKPADGKPGGLSPAVGQRLARRGVLRSGETGTVSFELGRSERLVSAFAELKGSARGDVDARAVLRCAGAPLAGARSDSRGRIELRRRDVGPGACSLVLGNRGSAAVYSVTITIEPVDRSRRAN